MGGVSRKSDRETWERSVATRRLILDRTTAKPYIMDNAKFQWDDVKAATNLADHGVTFEWAREVFADPFALDWLDASEDYGEDRYAIIGMARRRLLFVAYTRRGDAVRIISARGAEPIERRQYHEDRT
jgi:uncharacterized DUF497 family protein